MLRRFSTNFAIFSMLVDTMIVPASLWAVGEIRPLLSASFVMPIEAPQVLPISIYVIFSAVWVTIMALFSVYDGQKNLRAVDEFSSLTIGSLLAAVALAGILYFTYRDFSRVSFVLFVAITYVTFLLWRVLARRLYQASKDLRHEAQHVLVAGAGPVGMEIEGRVRAHQYLNLDFTGFLDDDPKKRQDSPKILGTLEDARRIVRDMKVTDLVVALPPRAYQRIHQLVTDVHDLPVRVWMVPDYFEFALHRAKMENFLDIPMLDLRAPALTENQRMLKRSFDLAVGCLLAVLTLPLMAAIAIVILIDDGMPILFKQRRMGENGRQFVMYKFRTMFHNSGAAEPEAAVLNEQVNPVHKRRDDPRVTRAGRFLRRWSLDELPQLLNVLRGTMSLVGPRPEVPALVGKYQPWQRKRFAVPQGMTGWWQIHGRSDRPMHLNTEDDLYYVQNYSIWLDIQILVQTFWIVLRGKGAY